MENLQKQQEEYFLLLDSLKKEVSKSRIKAALSVNSELILLYWSIGKKITQSLGKSNWGDSFLVQLSRDLSTSFPGIKGFSKSNLYNINQWFNFYKDADEKFQQVVGKIPWSHNIIISSKAKSLKEALWYINKTLENGWSRSILTIQFESNLYARQAKSSQISNFSRFLPQEQSDLANEVLKDPYVLDFIDEDRNERKLEKELIKHIQQFLIELGKGFSFVGSQYHLEVGGQDFYIDLLFYHLKLRCFVAIELKTKEFKPEYAGKMQFYLTALDKQVKHESDSTSIGIILCKEKNKMVAEYALHGISAPMGISSYEIKDQLPKKLQESLPTPEELAREFDQLENKKSDGSNT